MSKTQNPLRFNLRYGPHLCHVSVRQPSALSLRSSQPPSAPSEDYSVLSASLTRTHLPLCLHFPADLFKDNHIKNPCGGMRYIFIASCTVNSTLGSHVRYVDLFPRDIYSPSEKIKYDNKFNLCMCETTN